MFQELTHELWLARNERQHAHDVEVNDNRERQQASRAAEEWFHPTTQRRTRTTLLGTT